MPDNPEQPLHPERRACLRPWNAGYQIHLPPHLARAAGAESFPLPKLPMSSLVWQSGLTQLAWEEHTACLAVAMLLDGQSRRWLSVLPTQHCSASHVRWDYQSSDYASLPASLALLGSFQSASAATALEAQALVPAYDGLHIVLQHPTAQACSAWVFARCQGEDPFPIDPAGVFVDDLQATLRHYADRLLLT